ncbi:MAG: hypothetical protein ABI742_14370, partial [Gemmatimonadota bacterium]
MESPEEALKVEPGKVARTFTGQASLVGHARLDKVPADALLAARRLWSQERLDAAGSPDKLAAVLYRLATGLRGGLSRWIGTDGYGVLLDR